MAKDGVKKVKVTKTITKVVESSSDDSSSEEVPVIVNKGKSSTKAAQKAKKVVAESSSDDDSDDTPVVKAAPKKAAKVTKKVAVKKAESSDDSDDSSESEEVVVKKVVKKVTKKVVEKSSSDEESEEEVKPVKKAAPAKKQSKQVESSSDDDSSEEEAPVKKAAPAKKQSKQVESSSDEEEEETNGKPVQKKQEAEQKQQNGGETLAQNNGKWEAMVRGLSYEADENDIGNWFEEKGASVEAVKLLKDRESGKSRGMAFVTFEEEEGLRIALTLNSSEHMGRTIYVSNSADKDRAQRPDNQAGKGSTLPEGAVTCFVGNLSYKCADTDLRSLFAKCGGILGARIATSREDGRSRGFGHVDFDSQETANKALAMNGEDFQGRPIKVDAAEKKQGGGNRGGFGGNRGGRGGMNLSNNDRAAKKGTIVAFQGSKKTL